MDKGRITREEIEKEFPGWEAWEGVDRRWHARIRGAVPPVMVHGEGLVDLRDQVKAHVEKHDEFWRVVRKQGADDPHV
jgi:hypothetical protein